MNFAYINANLKHRFFIRKPKKYDFETGNSLYVFENYKKPTKIFKNQNIKIIGDESENICKNFVYIKTILQILKEKGLSDVTLCFDNTKDYIPLLEELFKKNVSFSLADCLGALETTDFFLEKYGHPVRIIKKVNCGLFVYFGGEVPFCNKGTIKLDFSNNLIGNKITIDEFLIKNISFPIKISSFGILDAALTLTGKKIKDIIIKPCIILSEDE